MLKRIQEPIARAVAALQERGKLPAGEIPPARLEPPKDRQFGDYASTIALACGQKWKVPPRGVAEKIRQLLQTDSDLFERVEVAGPGFLNLVVRPDVWRAELCRVVSLGADYLKSDVGGGARVLVEFVSANPTGPLHLAHGRGAVLGDVVVRLLRFTGHRVDSEFYVNDRGHQIDTYARSVHYRYLQGLGRTPTEPAELYPGSYVEDVARELITESGSAYADTPETEWLGPVSEFGVSAMLRRIRHDLETFGIHFDQFVSEQRLVEEENLDALVADLAEHGHVYEEDGKKWFRSTTFGDDKDRVMVREDGRSTYFVSDIAYHRLKLRRGYDHLINVWGADHAGVIKRLQAGLTAAGEDASKLETLFVQMVSLTRGGEAVRMGKRLGTAVWLSEVLSEAGADATRYTFAVRKADAQQVFDLDLVRSRSLDNPVYYAQMGHARLSSILRKAAALGLSPAQPSVAALAFLTLPEELGLVKELTRAPQVVLRAALEREPHQLTNYIQEIITLFHSYYTRYKHDDPVLSPHKEKAEARLLLCSALRVVLRTLMEDLLGVAAPEEMARPEGGEDV